MRPTLLIRLRRRVPTTGVLARALLAGSCLALAGVSCSTLLDIDHIEYGDLGTGAGAVGGGGGAGGSGGEEIPATCDDAIHNGEEEGVDCGGPTCDPCAEDCTNGVDDGGNQLVDCEDPVCAGFQCVEPAPTDWSGPAAFYTGAPPAPSCPPAWPDAGESGWDGTLTAPPATCSTCSCGSVTGASCEVPGTELHDVDPCGNLLTVETPLDADICHTFVAVGNNSSTGQSVTVNGGSCQPSGGTPSVPEATWEREALLCTGAEQGAGCGSDGAVCVRTPTAPYEGTLCIFRSGPYECPAGPYTELTTLYQLINDTRDCSSCSCGSPNGVTCTGTTTLYSDANCTTAIATVPNDGSTCVSHAEAAALQFSVDSGPSGGSCPHSGGAPVGQANGTGRVTVCCLP